MSSRSEPELISQFAFRIAEASGENIWYAAVVSADGVETFAGQLASAANELVSGSAVAERVDSPLEFEKSLRAASCPTWIAFGFERFDGDGWAKLDRDRSRLERALVNADGGCATVVVLVLDRETYGALQFYAPNLTSWIGGSAFELAAEAPLSSVVRELRLEELRQWADMTDDDVIRRAADKTLPADPYFAEWLVLLGRGDLLGNA